VGPLKLGEEQSLVMEKGGKGKVPQHKKNKKIKKKKKSIAQKPREEKGECPVKWGPLIKRINRRKRSRTRNCVLSPKKKRVFGRVVNTQSNST